MYDEYGMTEGEKEEADRLYAWSTMTFDQYHDIYGTLPPWSVYQPKGEQ